MARLPAHPRLARMLLAGSTHGLLRPACQLAAILAERAPERRQDADIGSLLEIVRGERPCPGTWRGWKQRIERQAAVFERLCGEDATAAETSAHRAASTGELLAFAYPDRIARRRPGGQSLWQLANGRSATLDPADPLGNAEWLVAAELGARAGDTRDRIFLAAAFDPGALDAALAWLVATRDIAEWDEAAGRFVAERQRTLGALLLARERLREVSAGQRRDALCAWIERRGLEVLPWTPALQQWRARIALLRSLHNGAGESPWPDLGDAALLQRLPEWLGPHLDTVNSLATLQRIDLAAILHALLPWPLPRELARLAPERIEVPSGSNVAIDYLQSPPVLSVKLQEMFGCVDTPCIAAGHVALQVHLLSPARRPLAVTQDLAGFWKNAYPEVRKEMRGRYPKHPWPEDPLAAPPTRHTRR
jgi:ATP-dependent helicase HrpB